MVLRIFTIVVVLFIAEVLFLLNKEPKTTKQKKRDIEFSTIEFKDIHYFNIDENGTNVMLKASSASKYKNHDDVEDIDVQFKNMDRIDSIKATKAIFIDDKIYLTQNILYENNESMFINTEDLEYNTKTKVAKSHTEFTLTTPRGIARGDSFAYDMKNKKLNSENITFITEEGTKEK